MSNKLKLFLFFSLFVLCTLSFVLLPKGAVAQIPSDTKIACDEISETEFHSLRPYQANIKCSSQMDKYATFCGNDLTLKDTITESYPGSGDCTTAGGKVTCKYTATVSKPITIDLGGAELPIMGRTQDDVINSQNLDETLSDADKINNYVSWYLNGTNSKAEYPFSVKVADYAGPINKLLPQEVAQQQRAQTVNAAKDTRHDQIVGCTYGIEIPLLGKELGGIPGPCYDSGLVSLLPQVKHRLTEWEKHLPPVRSDPKYKNYIDYQKALEKWRGKACMVVKIPDLIPVIGGKGIILCLDDLGNPNYYSALYPYIPLSSTEDVEGKIKIDSVSSATNLVGSGAVVTGVKFSKQTPSTLFFSHMEESNQLGQILQKTYIPKDADEVGSPTNISTETSCKDVEVRSNAGDDLFASQITGTLSYTATFSCVFKTIENVEPEDCVCVDGIYTGDRCGSLIDKPCTVQPTIPDIQTCKKDIYIRLSTTSSSPQVDDVWSRLVAGPMAVFKRIYPKTNTAGSVGQIMDIAGGTNITYSGEGISQSNTDLKIPHVGGISEYFLKGIQTALRPKGFGEAIAFAKNILDKPDGSEADCDITAPDVSSQVPRLITKEALHELAIRWEGAEGDLVLECYNDVVRKSLAAGIDPALTLLIWINESGGSNYNLSWQDFGINYSFYKGFTKQINRFFELPDFYRTDSRWASCFGQGVDTEMFFSIYYTGLCDPTNLLPGHQYIDLINTAWNWFTSCGFTGYPFKASCY
jgi:hypothetical protein